MLYGSIHSYCSLFRCVRIYILELNYTNIIFVGRILPNIQVREHSGAMLKCNGSGKIFTLSWSLRQDSIVKRSLGNGRARAFWRVQSTLDFRIYLSEKPHKSNVHTEALTQRSKPWNVRGEQTWTGNEYYVVCSIKKWFMCVRNCTLYWIWKRWRKQYFLKIPPPKFILERILIIVMNLAIFCDSSNNRSQKR